MVASTDLKVYRSTGDLGGAITGTLITSGISNNLFVNVTQAQQSSGEDFYKCVYLKNTHPSESMDNFKLWLSSKSFPPDTEIRWGYDPTPASAQTIADVFTEPAGISWRELGAKPDTIDILKFASGDIAAIWIWYHVIAGAKTRVDDFEVFSFEFLIPQGGSGGGGGPLPDPDPVDLDLDKFGVNKLFPTIAGGKEWFNKWDVGGSRSITPDTFDPQDNQFGVNSATLTVNGDGTATWATLTNSSRAYVHGPWTNTEMTVYVKVDTSCNSIQLRSRSNHHGVQELPYQLESGVNQISCGFGNYIVSWSPDVNTTEVQVEVIHDLYKRDLDQLTSAGQPAGNGLFWGYKQITRTIDNNRVLVQGWINRTVGDQTAWAKDTEFIFNGTNVHIDPTGFEENVQTCLDKGDKISGDLDKNTLWLNPGYWCWLRFNDADDVILKYFSVREIAPMGTVTNPPPSGGGGGNPPPTPTNYRIAVAGDWGCENETDDVLSLINTNAYDLVVGVGDNAYAAPDCWINRFNPIKNKMESAFGNHEYEESGGISPYKTFFAYNLTYFTFKFQNMQFFVFDTNINFDSGSGQHTAMTKAITDSLTDNTVTWRACVFHHPMFGASSQHTYSDGNFNNTWQKFFEDNKINLVMCGHNHNWQRTFQVVYNSGDQRSPTVVDSTSPYSATTKGLIHVVTGAGGHDSGSSLYSLGGQPAFQAYQNRSNNGIWSIEASNNGQTLTCAFINTAGDRFDQFVYNST